MKRSKEDAKVIDARWPAFDGRTMWPKKNADGRLGYPLDFIMSDGRELHSFMPADLLPPLPRDIPELERTRAYQMAIAAWHIRHLLEMVPPSASVEFLAEQLIRAIDRANETFASIPDHIERAFEQEAYRRAVERGDIEPPEFFDDDQDE